MKNNYSQLFGIAIISAITITIVSCETGNKKEAKTETAVSEKQHPIMVFAATSLTDVLSEIIDSFEVKHNIKVQTNMASSGTLARQIEQGGNPDVYISANKRWADYVDSLGFILPGTRTTIAGNNLVLIAPQNCSLQINAIDSTLDFVSLLGKGRLSMGDPAHVPAGKYAKQSLEYFGWYNMLAGKILPAKDVRSALMIVELEESPLGIIYRTDALKSSKVKILNTFPETSHKPIVYEGGICKDNTNAKAFFEYLHSNSTTTIWVKYGFIK